MTPERSQPTILIIDDDDAHRALARRALRGMQPSMNVLEASTLLEAEQAISENAGALRLIVLDLHLGDGSGINILRDVRALFDYHKLPVLMLSTSNVETDYFESYRIGANCYVIKAPDPLHFRTNLRSAVHFLLCPVR